MNNADPVLPPSQAKAFYDRFGPKQDKQGFYENPAMAELISHADFGSAGKVFEFGCGTGRLALRLLSRQLPDSAIYLGCDISETMIILAARRLAGFAERAMVVRTGGSAIFPLADHAVDRVICCYVADLLSENEVRQLFAEAQRTLTSRGKLCLVSLTRGVTIPSRLVSSLWMTLFRLRLMLLGGCRPIQLERYADRKYWRIEHHAVLTPFGVPSEVLILTPKFSQTG